MYKSCILPKSVFVTTNVIIKSDYLTLYYWDSRLYIRRACSARTAFIKTWSVCAHTCPHTPVIGCHDTQLDYSTSHIPFYSRYTRLKLIPFPHLIQIKLMIAQDKNVVKVYLFWPVIKNFKIKFWPAEIRGSTSVYHNFHFYSLQTATENILIFQGVCLSDARKRYKQKFLYFFWFLGRTVVFFIKSCS